MYSPIPQSHLIPNLEKYLKYKDNPLIYIPEYKFIEEGLCYGLSVCYSTMGLINKLDWWNAALNSLGKWDGTEESLAKPLQIPGSETPHETLGSLFDKVINYIYYNHANPFYLPSITEQDYNQGSFLRPNGPFEYLDKDGKIKHIKQQSTASGSFTAEDLQLLLEDPETQAAISKGICLVSSKKHSCNLQFVDGQWCLYDPNNGTFCVSLGFPQKNFRSNWSYYAPDYEVALDNINYYTGTKASPHPGVFTITIATAESDADLSKFEKAYERIVEEKATIISNDAICMIALSNPSVIRTLIENNTIKDVNALYKGQSLLDLLTKKDSSYASTVELSLIEYLIDKGISLENQQGLPFLLSALFKEDTDLIELLLERNAPIPADFLSLCFKKMEQQKEKYRENQDTTYTTSPDLTARDLTARSSKTMTEMEKYKKWRFLVSQLILIKNCNIHLTISGLNEVQKLDFLKILLESKDLNLEKLKTVLKEPSLNTIFFKNEICCSYLINQMTTTPSFSKDMDFIKQLIAVNRLKLEDLKNYLADANNRQAFYRNATCRNYLNSLITMPEDLILVLDLIPNNVKENFIVERIGVNPKLFTLAFFQNLAATNCDRDSVCNRLIRTKSDLIKILDEEPDKTFIYHLPESLIKKCEPHLNTLKSLLPALEKSTDPTEKQILALLSLYYYQEERGKEKLNFNPSFFGLSINKMTDYSFEFGVSKQKKLAAVSALLDGLKNNESLEEIMARHTDALTNGFLADIFTALKEVLPTSVQHKSSSGYN